MKAAAEGHGGTVHPEARARRSLSREVTYQQDLRELDEIQSALERVAEELAGDLTARELVTTQITLKIRFVPFETRSHSVRLPAPTNDLDDIKRAGLKALDDVELARPVRLLGLRATLRELSR